MIWWQEILVNLSKGVAYSFPILTFFGSLSFFVNYLLKDDKVQNLSRRKREIDE
jgi:hypothetical protein